MPTLARVYHLPPREQALLTLRQFRDLQFDYRQLQEQQEGVI